MKRKLAILLTAVCAISLLGGCGNKDNKDKDGKKEDNKTVIEYNAADYVTLGEYKGMEISLESSYEVTDEDVRSSVESLLKAYPKYEDTDKTAVENGDFVNIDYEGLKDGTAFDGGTAQNQVLEIGSNSFIEGFETGLIGKNVGEKVSLNLTFPENYQEPSLAGQAVVFNVTINKIVNKVDVAYDAMTDEYVKSNFSTQGYETVDALKAGMKSNLEDKNESAKQSDTQNAVVAKMKEICKVDKLPEGLLDQRVKEYKEQMEENLKSSQNMEMSDYLKQIGSTEEEFNTQVVDYVQNNLETELILQAIAEKEEIKVEEEDFSKYIKAIASNLNYDSEDALIEQYGEDYVKKVYVRDKALELVAESAVVSYGTAADSQQQ